MLIFFNIKFVKLIFYSINIDYIDSPFRFNKSKSTKKLLLTTNEFSRISFIDFMLLKYDEESKDSYQSLKYSKLNQQIIIQASKLTHIKIHEIFNESNIDSWWEGIKMLLLISNQVTYHFKYEGSNELNSLSKFLPSRSKYWVSKFTNFYLNNYDIFNNPPDIGEFISIWGSVWIKNLIFCSKQDDDYKIVADLLNLKSVRDNLQEIVLISKYLSNWHEILDLLTKWLQIRKIKIEFKVNDKELESDAVKFMKNQFYKKARIIESLDIDQEITNIV